MNAFADLPVEQKVVRKTEPKPALPKLNLADYLEGPPTPPPTVDRSNPGNSQLADSLGNTDWGDCGEAMTLHGIELFHLDAQTQVPPFVTPDALGLYAVVGGFDPSQGAPGQNPTDRGTDNQVLVDKWRDVGVHCAGDNSTHKIVGSLFVDPKDQALTRLAIWEFVVLFRAVGLPVTAQSQSGQWRLTDPSLQGDAAIGSWGYHDIPYFSYDQNGVLADSWGQPYHVDWDFDKAYAVQGFVVVTQEMLNLQGVSPAGFDWTRINADLKNFPPVPSS